MRLWKTIAVVAIVATPAVAKTQNIPRRVYVVPGIHYGTLSRTSVALAAFLDGREGVIGKGHIVVLEGGRDVMKGQVGIANVSQSAVGHSAHLSFMRTRERPPNAQPNTSYAGTEVHLYVSVLNFGAGFYAPVSKPQGKRGLLHLSIGLGF